jgi:hypothetical protein
MAIVDQKEKVFGNIGALRTLTDDFPKLKLNNSFPSINNGGNVQDFLVDLLKSLVGYEEVRDTLVDILVYATSEAEIVVKEALKVELKGLVACGVDPSLPDWFTTNGIEMQVKKVDFLNIFKIDPTTQAGSLIYNDVAAQYTSTDYNTYLYYTIQDADVPHIWSDPNTGENILEATFGQNTYSKPNSVVFKPTTNITNLTDLNNKFVDSLKLFASEDLIVNIIDSLFGTIAVQGNVNKSESELEMEGKLDTIISCIINADEDYVIDNAYFEFDNAQIQNIKENATNRRNGVRQLKTCGDVDISIPISYLLGMKSQLTALTETQLIQKREVIGLSINSMATETANQGTSDPVDQYSVELSFVGLMFGAIIKSIVSSILSPKVITVFLINYMVVYGQNSTYADPIDFLAKNKTLLENMVKRIRDMIIKALLDKILKYIMKLIAANAVEMLKEKANAQLAMLLSLVGVPQDVIRMIRENSSIQA